MAATPSASGASAEQPSTTHLELSAAAWLQQVPIIEVAFNNGMWWSIPPEISQALYQKHLQGEDACYTWDKRCYVIDFDAMEQKNIDVYGRYSLIKVQVR